MLAASNVLSDGKGGYNVPAGVRVLDAGRALQTNDFEMLVEVGLMMNNVGVKEDALKCLRRACDLRPSHKNDQVHNALARLESDTEARIKHAKRYVELQPTATYGWLLLGNYQDNAENYEEALVAYRTGLEMFPSEYRYVISCCRMLGRLDKEDEALEVAKTAVTNGVLHDCWQRPSHFVKGLSAQAWRRDVQNWRVARVLESNFEMIRDEAMTAYDSGRLAQEGVLDTEHLAISGQWKELNLIFQGLTQVKNCELCPKITELVEKEIPEAASMVRGAMKLSILTPGTVVKPHSGPSNTRMRAHLGIRIPDGCYIRAGDPTDESNVRQWEEGRVLCFDDSFRHEVWHEGSEPRIVLIIDVWHPDMSHQARLEACENQLQQQVYLARYSAARERGIWN